MEAPLHSVSDTDGLTLSGHSMLFVNAPLIFVAHRLSDVFAKQNNKTLRETLAHRRYSALSQSVAYQYPDDLDKPIGLFLAELKAIGDSTYRRFLNPHGDKTYCHFRLADGENNGKKGLYLYLCNQEIVYIGRSYDPFSKRVDQGYGKIHPKNCFLDGQSTNCHLNSLIEEQHLSVSFYVCPMAENGVIETTERALIQERKPRWNIALTR